MFIVAGLTLLLFVAYELVGTSQVTKRNQEAVAAAFDDSIDRSLRPSAMPAPKPKRVYRGPDPVARLRIPSIGVSRYVVEGTSLGDLSWGPGHYSETPLPGEKGSTAIAGHRTGWGSPFINLDLLRPGDDVFIETTKNKTYRYQVTRTKIVQPNESWVLAGDPESKAEFKLTLTTCTPKYTSLKRLIVWADQVEGP